MGRISAIITSSAVCGATGTAAAAATLAVVSISSISTSMSPRRIYRPNYSTYSAITAAAAVVCCCSAITAVSGNCYCIIRCNCIPCVS